MKWFYRKKGGRHASSPKIIFSFGLILFLLNLLGCSSSSSEDKDQKNVSLSGFVTNGPIEGTTVKVYDSDDFFAGDTSTNTEGYFYVDRLPESSFYLISTEGGTLHGQPYPGSLKGIFKTTPCYLTPLSTAIFELVQKHDLGFEQAQVNMMNWLGMDEDPFVASLEGRQLDGINLEAIREAIVQQGLESWIAQGLYFYENDIPAEERGSGWFGSSFDSTDPDVTLPEQLQYVIPGSFSYNATLTEAIRESIKEIEESLPVEDNPPPMTELWWIFTHSDNVNQAYQDLNLPAGAVELEPTFVPLGNLLSSHMEGAIDIMTGIRGIQWQEQLLQLSHEYGHLDQNVAAAGWRFEGDAFTVSDDPKVPVEATVFLNGQNVSQWSAAIIVESGDGDVSGTLLPDQVGDTLTGRVLPGTYEAIFFSDTEETQAWLNTQLNVMPGHGATVVVELELWDLPSPMPWSIADLEEDRDFVSESDTAGVSFFILYVMDPYVNPYLPSLAQGTHLLVSCNVHKDWSLLETSP